MALSFRPDAAMLLTIPAARSSLGNVTSLAFDTHKAVKALKEAGADERLAEAVVATIGDAMGENVATKADIAAVRSDIAALRSETATDIAAVRSETTAEIAAVRSDIATLRSNTAAMEARLYHHLWGMAVGIVGLTVALVKLIT